MTGPLLFSIIIANYNKGDNIRNLLSSIYEQYCYDDFEVLFMDDASTDASVAAAQEFPVRLYPRAERVGPATLRNMAAEEARGDYLLFVDSDVILPAGTLLRFRQLCLGGGFGAVSGLEVLPPVIDNWIGWFRTLQVQDYFGAFRCREGALAAWGSTLGGVRKELFLHAGGFNEAYKGADVEDHELAVKLARLEPMIFSPQMTYRHSYPATFDLIRKQFRRASQMMQLESGALLQSPLLFRWRYKAGHLVATALIAVAAASPFLGYGGYLLAILVLAKICINRYLFREALRLKGVVFLLYTFVMSLVMGMSIVSGAIYGKVSRVSR
jgi:glycosyltransferase involved in cell wall biosynthesis